ncbi:hypothetical protein [Nocardia crassostreae]|uniref:hypothetical protein n=1 Tax=Nocardia crassostreae TaxID=53428 RepID=UPI00082F2894|nr:hypothetical protein [Nocardia crassostreae]
MNWWRSRGDEPQGRDEARRRAGADPIPLFGRISRLEHLLQDALARADAEPDPAARARLLLAGIRAFLAEAEDEIGPNRILLQSRLIETAASYPDESLRLLADASWWCDIEEATAHRVFTCWLHRPDPATFPATWTAAAGMLTQSSALRMWLANTVRDPDSVVSPEFRALARTHLTAVVDDRFDQYEFKGATSPVWQLLHALGPTGRADWFCLLRDRAAADHRYELADRFGGKGIRDRKQRLHDFAAHRRLRTGTTDPDKLRGPSTPSEYRHLLLAAAALMRGESAARHLTEAKRDGTDRLQPSAHLLTALESLRTGNRADARTHLTALLDHPPRSASDTDILANANILLGALARNDRQIAEAARTLHTRHGAAWPAHALVQPTTVLSAVARAEPELLSTLLTAASGESNRSHAGDPSRASAVPGRPLDQLELVDSDVRLGRIGSGLEGLRLAAARGVLMKAVRAVLFSRVEEAWELFREAGLLLAGATGVEAERLRGQGEQAWEVAARLHDHGPLQRAQERLAYAALQEDGVSQPWTDGAFRQWADLDDQGLGDYRTLHHLAVAAHAHAYRRELDGDPAACDEWRAAHGYWARLHADQAFWDELRTHLGAVLPDATAGDIALAVEDARAELPVQLLEPHVTLVLELRKQDMRRARIHLGLIEEAPFPASDIGRARGRLAREAGAQIRRLIREGQLERALEEARSWASIMSRSISAARGGPGRAGPCSSGSRRWSRPCASGSASRRAISPCGAGPICPTGIARPSPPSWRATNSGSGSPCWWPAPNATRPIRSPTDPDSARPQPI